MSEFYDNPWFKESINKNRKIMLLLFIPPVFCLFMVYYTFINDPIPKAKMPIAITQAAKYYRQPRVFIQSYTRFFSSVEFRILLGKVGIYLVFPLVVGGVIFGFHPIYRYNRKLKKALKMTVGSVNREDNKEILAFWTPVGVMIDTFGKDPKELSGNNSIWAPLNLSINKEDWRVDPDNQTVVIFLSKFKLQDKYMYSDLPPKKKVEPIVS